MQEIIKITRVSEKEFQTACRWACRQHFEVMLEIFKLQKNYFFQLKSKHSDLDLSLLGAASFVKAVVEIYNLAKNVHKKNRTDDIKNVKNPTKIRSKMMQNYKQRDKFDKLLNIQNVILELREKEKLSFRKISQYLLKFHRLEVSHTLVSNFYKFLKNGD